MSISGALNNAISGLTTTSRMAEITSSNLSNALTDGYGRRSLDLSAAELGGVRATGVHRHVDAGLLADRRLADAALGGQQRSAGMLARLEQTIGTPEDQGGIGARLAALEQALISASSDPASENRLRNVAGRLQDVTDTLNGNARQIQTLRVEADRAIADDINDLNNALVQVGDLNRDIQRLKSTGSDISPLLDARQKVVDKIAEIVPVREVRRDNDTIGLMTVSGMTLLDGRPAQFGFQPTPTITADMTLASGALSGVTRDGVSLDPAGGIGRLDGGTLGASFALRDRTLVDAQAGLDNVAADLIARFQDPATDPTLMAGDAGLLTDQGNPLDPLDLPGLAGRIGMNASIDPAQGGDVTRLRDGLNAAAPGPTGSPAQIDRWLSALGESRADLPGTPARSAAGRAADFIRDVGQTRLQADETLSFAAARHDTLREAELAQGVDSDQELQTLLRVEQAYAANARVIQTIDFMMQRLMEI
ncbi:flagellar hook-associated protein FlgK [Yoonia sp. 2307UL14-13]|uniref:flagellar hook-associated protein FlgK n=1 Tax=Yoonia sp. 2307UL14-13 TaxID=3126506 RepID=UPI003098DCA2